MEIQGKHAIITGAGSGIGMAVANELARRGVAGLGLVDRSEAVDVVARQINDQFGRPVATSHIGDVTCADFRAQTFDKIGSRNGPAQILVPAAGVTRDSLAVKLDKTTGKAEIYDEKMFQLVIDVNLLAPTYWALEMVGRIAEDRYKRGLKRWSPAEHIQGTAIFIGSVSSQGNKGQIAYAATKAGIQGVAATLMKEAMFHGVRCGVIHPGFTNTPMVGAMNEQYIRENVLPFTQLGRLIEPAEIADAICFMIGNSAVSGELWADAGWHPSA